MEAYEETSTAPALRSHRDAVRLPLWVTLAALGILIAALAWGQFSIIAAEQRFEAERQAFAERLDSQHMARLARARQALAQETDDAYRLFGAALGWIVRDAMTRGNLAEIDRYFTDILTHKRVRLVLLADPDDKVLVSSDRNFEDFAFSRYFPAALLQEPAVAVRSGDGSLKQLVVPIRGVSSKLGTVLLVYEGPALPAY